MMFLLDLAFAVEILALGLGGYFLVWAQSSLGSGTTGGAGAGLAKKMGYIIITLAILVMLCTTFYGTMYWYKGYFSSPMAAHQMQMKNCNCGSGSMMGQ